ncbi:transcription factor WRKY45-2-like [Phragmites australis]|uniref:transcription factor WRKY45-2-like n=1 Tax=Phragmites australis TaxID=29695 RepID=UPI002D7914C5|nr:transcription factor WRKY45-2-like [Phragmites australis]
MSMAAAAPYAQVMEEMLKGRELAARLQCLLRDSPKAGLADQVLHAISRAIGATRAAASQEGSEAQTEVACAGGVGGKRKAASGGGGERRGGCRRRTQQSSVVTLTMKDVEDGHSWRKYGQKEIHNSKHPKAYFRCSHKYDQQCAAQRHVQRCDEAPDTYRVTYIGVHTCQDPAAVAPIVVHHTTAADGLHAGSRLISFAPTASATGTTSTTTTATANTNNQGDQKDAVLPVSVSGLKLEGGDQEEVLSSLTPAGSSAAAEAMRNAAATPGPDQGDVTSSLQHCYDGAVGMAYTMNDDVFDLDDIVFGFDHGQGDY